MGDALNWGALHTQSGRLTPQVASNIGPPSSIVLAPLARPCPKNCLGWEREVLAAGVSPTCDVSLLLDHVVGMIMTERSCQVMPWSWLPARIRRLKKTWALAWGTPPPLLWTYNLPVKAKQTSWDADQQQEIPLYQIILAPQHINSFITQNNLKSSSEMWHFCSRHSFFLSSYFETWVASFLHGKRPRKLIF
jgi:hypothetical protein